MPIEEISSFTADTKLYFYIYHSGGEVQALSQPKYNCVLGVLPYITEHEAALNFLMQRKLIALDAISKLNLVS